MIKKLFLLLAVTVFSLHMISCTSSGGSEDSSDEMTEASNASVGDGLEDVDSSAQAETDPANLEATPGDTVATETGTAETLPDDALSASNTDELSLEEPTVEPTDTASTTSSDSLTPIETAPADQAPVPDAVASTTDVPPVMTDSSADPSMSAYSEKSIATSGTTVKTYSSGISGGSIQKVALTPWKVDGILFNAVYFAKPGDTLKSISKTVYGEDRSKELKKGNPMFKSRAVKPGDKVYYTSTSRPQDDTRVLTYYEDQGMQPQVYVAKNGDTVKSVSKELFGYRDGWKELYSMNSFESKSSLSAGTEIRYFPYSKNADPAPTHAAVAQVPPVQSMIPAPPQETALPPPPQEQEMVPPPVQAGTELPPPPPPPAEPPQEMAPPPPPPVAEKPKRPIPEPAEIAEAPPIWEDTNILLGAGCLALVGIGGIFVVRSRKKKQADLDAALNQHVGT